MKIAAHILASLIGIGFAIQALQWIFAPAAAAEGLGMPLLEGIGASTQIGDLGAFFLVSAIMIGLGHRHGQSHWLYPPAMLICGAAVMRTLAAVIGPAAFASQLIATEIVITLILLGAARIFANDPAADVL
jgi:hypothetical protein